MFVAEQATTQLLKCAVAVLCITGQDSPPSAVGPKLTTPISKCAVTVL